MESKIKYKEMNLIDLLRLENRYQKLLFYGIKGEHLVEYIKIRHAIEERLV
jgi:hypothetical protein